MKRETTLTHEFVGYIPQELKEGTVYVSIPFATVTHKCCCGCGKEVVTPLTPTDWQLTFDGETISLEPSIGNWNFECQSHYWIKRNRVKWAPRWSRSEIEAGRSHDRLAKLSYFEDAKAPHVDACPAGAETPTKGAVRESFWRRLKKWWQGTG
jgi:hypothetical protein